MHSHILPFVEASPPNSKNYSAGGSLESFTGPFTTITASCTRPVAIHLPMLERQVWSLGWEDPLEKEMAAHSSILAWEIPWTEEPGGQSMGSQKSQTRLSDETTDNSNFYSDFSFSCCLHTVLYIMDGVSEDREVLHFSMSNPAFSYNKILLFLSLWVMTVTQQLAADCSL